MTHNFFSPSIHQISAPTSVICCRASKMLYNRSHLGWLPIFLLSTLLKPNFFLLDLNNNSLKYMTALTTIHSARNVGFIFDEHLNFSDQITALSKSCYCHIRELRCIRSHLDFKTASTIAITSILHSKLDYYNYLYHNLPKCQLNRISLYNSLYGWSRLVR